MKQRIVVAVILSALLLAVLYAGGIVFLIVLSVASLFGVYETAHITPLRGFRPHTLPAYVFAVLYPFAYYFGGIRLLFATFFVFIVASIIGLVLRRSEEPENAIVSLLFFVYPLSLFLCVMLVYFYENRTLAVTMTAFMFIIPILTDTFAYFGGTLFGKEKLCPSISPKKTVEGAACGLLGGIVTAVAVFCLQSKWNGSTPWAVLVITGLLCSAVGQFGDLFASLLKRWAGVKDYSRLFPGHGGIMDRLDSILLCAPVVLSLFMLLEKVGLA